MYQWVKIECPFCHTHFSLKFSHIFMLHLYVRNITFFQFNASYIEYFWYRIKKLWWCIHVLLWGIQFTFMISLVIYFSDPPLAEDDLPPGEWICHQCRVCPKPPPAKEVSCIFNGPQSEYFRGLRYCQFVSRAWWIYATEGPMITSLAGI